MGPSLAKRLTLCQGRLANLDVPAMTMVFTAEKLLDGVKEGDKVKFTADRKDGVYLVTAIEAAK